MTPAAVKPLRVAVLISGRGSNMLVSDDGFAGVAIVMSKFTDYLDIARTGARHDRN